jgi:hypothetical protein
VASFTGIGLIVFRHFAERLATRNLLECFWLGFATTRLATGVIDLVVGHEKFAAIAQFP